MSTPKKPGPLAQIGAGIIILAAITGMYLFQGDGRKPGPAEAVTLATPVPHGIGKDYAPGALAAFLIKPDRRPVPDFAFQDHTGKPLTIAQWKGRVVLVNLWATWCAPCRKEMPGLDKLQKELGSAKFEVVALAIDRAGRVAQLVHICDAVEG